MYKEVVIILRDMPKIIAIMFTGFFLILVISYYSLNNYRQDSITKGMQETLKVAAIANRDDSARIEAKKFGLIKKSFEEDFKKSFNKNKNLHSEVTKYTFDYLMDSNDGIKAIKVKVISEKKEYQATCILNVAN